ncbi:MAG: hypothetical protein U9R43_13380 [Thermodesulfobacteriota bacterium]|nr:hypothetical protein [Thermodesulfobacteriota bacterium]
MKKIVIKTSRPEHHYGLMASLNKLFPECEIQITTERAENLGYNDLIINRKSTPCKNINDLQVNESK